MNVMHMLARASTGGIESLCREYADHSAINNIFVILWGKNEINAEVMKKRGHIVYELNSKKAQVMTVFVQLIRIVKKHKVDAIIVHHEAPIMYIYQLIFKVLKRNLTTIIYAHNDAKMMCRERKVQRRKIRKLIIMYSLRHCDAVIAISDAVKRSLMNYCHTESEKIKVIYNGVNVSRYLPDCTAEQKKRGKLKFVYVGRVVKEKGIQTTIRAFTHLSENKEWEFDVVGDGSYRRELETMVLKEHLENRIFFRGEKNNIPQILKGYDVFIHMPEYEEGFGISVVEAMAAGLVCVCARKGGIPEIVTDKVDGFLIESEDELIVLLKKIVNKNQGFFYEIGTAAIEKAKKYDISIYSSNLDFFIQETVRNIDLKVKSGVEN